MKHAYRLTIPLIAVLLLGAGCQKTASTTETQNPAAPASEAGTTPATDAVKAPETTTQPAVTQPVAPKPAVKTTPKVTTPAPTPAPVNVLSGTINASISNFEFNPKTITVKKGSKVVWKNNDRVPHTVSGDKGTPNSPELAVGDSYSYTFNTVGTFNYHCAYHPTMKGTVIVVE